MDSANSLKAALETVPESVTSALDGGR